MTEPTRPEPVTSADELYAIIAARPAAEGRAQADQMIAAATSLLLDREGVDGTLAALGRLADYLRSARPGAAPEPPRPADPVGPMLDFLRGLPMGQALNQANAAMTAAGMFITEAFGCEAPVAAPSAPARPHVVSPVEMALATVEQLGRIERGEAHERARGIVAGAAGYLHTVHGRTYASAVLAGVLDAAAAYGDEVRGGRDTLDTLH